MYLIPSTLSNIHSKFINKYDPSKNNESKFEAEIDRFENNISKLEISLKNKKESLIINQKKTQEIIKNLPEDFELEDFLEDYNKLKLEDANSASAKRIKKELEKKNPKLFTSLNNQGKDEEEIVKNNIDIKENTRLLKDEKDFKETFNKENLEKILIKVSVDGSEWIHNLTKGIMWNHSYLNHQRDQTNHIL